VKFNEHSEQTRAPHTNGLRDVPRCGALSLIQKTLITRFNSKPNGTEANDASRSVRSRRGIQNLSGAEVWAAAFRGREEEREGEGRGGEDGILLNPLVGMFAIFGPDCLTPGLRLKRSARGTYKPPEARW